MDVNFKNFIGQKKIPLIQVGGGTPIQLWDYWKFLEKEKEEIFPYK